MRRAFGKKYTTYKWFPEKPDSESVWRITMRPEFDEAVMAARKKLGIDIEELYFYSEEEPEYLAVFDFFCKVAQADETWELASQIAHKLKIDEKWVGNIAHKIALDDEAILDNPEGLLLVVEVGEDKESTKMTLELNEHTSLAQIKKYWPAILKEIGQYKGTVKKTRPWKKMGRDWYIFYLAQSGRTISQISQAIKKSYGEDLDYGNIKKIESNFRKKLSISKKYKTTKLKTGLTTGKRALPIEDSD